MVSLFPVTVTEDLQLEKNQGVFRNDPDEDDSDLSEEEDFDPEEEDSIQGPVVGFTGRGPHDAQSAAAPPKKKTDKDKKQTATKDESKSVPKDVKSRGKTNQKTRTPNPDNYK